MYNSIFEIAGSKS